MSAHGLRGFAVGVLSLTALEVLVSSKNAAGSVAGAATGISGLVQRALDPTVAAIPNPAGYQPGGSSGGFLQKLKNNMTWASDTTGGATIVPAVQTTPTTTAPTPSVRGPSTVSA